MRESVSVSDLLAALGREEQALKKLGAFAEASGIRAAITRLLKMADEPELKKGEATFNTERR